MMFSPSKMKALLCMSLFLCLVLTAVCAFADGEWYCPSCGRLNDNQYCPVDGTKKPDDLENVVVTEEENEVAPEEAATPDETAANPEASESEEVIEEVVALPFLSETYPGGDAVLRLLNDESSRVQSFSGPGKNYSSAGGYKPYKQTQITAYFIQDDWVLVDFRYSTSEERFVYLRKSAFSSLPELPEVTELPYYDGVFIESSDAVWGPDSRFNSVGSMAVPAGTPIRVFFQESGYLYGEYEYGGGMARMWFPAGKIAVYGVTVTYVDGIRQNGRSSFGYATVSSSDSLSEEDRAAGWSAWQDYEILPNDGIEVRTRTLYRRIPDGDISRGWSPWSEDPFAYVVSSYDISEAKIQYSFRQKTDQE